MVHRKFQAHSSKKFEKPNCKANGKAISTFDFSTFYTKLSHFDLVSMVNDIIKFAFKGGNK